jgi:MoxR-like ATPase
MTESMMDPQMSDVMAVEKWEHANSRLRGELRKQIVGQDDVIEQMLVAILANGHCLLEGVPGLAKTLMVSTLASALDLQFSRIQFTPDLMPSDITGTDVLQEDPVTKERRSKFVPGPIFTNMLLGDEINRTPPKTQAAMLESMQERHVSIGTTRHELPQPFFVLATQNPLEKEGTYPLPEAQLDRFLLYVKVDYPDAREEWEIARRVTSQISEPVEPVLTGADIIYTQELVQRLPVADQVVGYCCALVRSSRPGRDEAPDFVNKWVSFGAGPRGVLTLIRCAKSRAVLQGRFHATIEDVQAIAKPALRHRIAPNYAALAAGVNSERLVEMLIEHTPTHVAYEMPAE